MATLYFKVKLLSDVILNVKSATQGNNQTLDYIPGSCFMGILAKELFDPKDSSNDDEYAWEIIQSSRVKISDAHPLVNGYKSVRTPATFYYPKDKKVIDECYIHSNISEVFLKSEVCKKLQLKQCRGNFISVYDINNKELVEYKSNKNFAIKSAYDSRKRRSEDEKMYGYQSLNKFDNDKKNAFFIFEVECPDSLSEKIETLLKGVKFIGRSKHSQFGKVEISREENIETFKSAKFDNQLLIYAEDRLIFLDENLNCKFKIDEKNDLNLSSGKINWGKSQIITFQYAPWNSKRGCFDSDRIGIEKGSVIVIDGFEGDFATLPNYIGNFNNEGFGKVIYNPIFLKSRNEDSGRSLFSFHCDFKKVENKTKEEKRDERIDQSIAEIKTLGTKNPLLNYLKKQKADALLLDLIFSGCKSTQDYEGINKFVEANKGKFKGKTFASQWGHIRQLAVQYSNYEDLYRELFVKIDPNDPKKKNKAYLKHGVAAEKWNEANRIGVLKKFFDTINPNKMLFIDKEYSEEAVQLIIVNLASQMAKECKK